MGVYSSGSCRSGVRTESPSVYDEPFWECSYCGSSNIGQSLKCNGCGATRKKGESYYSPSPYIVYVDDSDEKPKKKGLFGKLFGG